MGFFMQGTLGGDSAAAAAQTATQLLQQQPANEVEPISILELAMKGGLTMIPLAILSVVTVYLIVERWIAIRKAGRDEKNFLNNISDYIQSGKLDSARALCKSTDTPIANMIEKGISRIGQPMEDISVAVENVAKLEVYRMEKNLSILATIAGAAPMLGLIGTVMGMVGTFYNIANSPDGIQIGALSGGVYEAMVATVAGLIVGVTAFIGYNLLVASVQKVVYILELRSVEFLDILSNPSR